MDKTNFVNFAQKYTTEFKIIFMAIVLWSKLKEFANFQKKYSFLSYMRFFQNENFAVQAAKFAEYLKLDSYKITDRHIVPVYENR